MRDKFRSEWAKLGRSAPATPARPVIRILDLPGFRSLEDKRILSQPLKGPFTDDFDVLTDALSENTFGITRAQTQYVPPDYYNRLSEDDPRLWDIYAARDRHEAHFLSDGLPYDEKAAYLETLGWDFTDQPKALLQITDLFCRQAEAAAKGIAGRMPDISTLGLESWGARMEHEARRFKRSGRVNPTESGL